ncbi:MAG: peptidylprolyl isomerase [Oceanospirillales bacterium]|uniref:Peptidyl-prolyl cis-trans isomerase n=1 Tax=Marinobacterium halophilum TaxID=267374 RepID=A0A2P8EUW5_9GAMM|nr:peptidylprolyl isomerase [Marinobacterium halophilum]MBR9827330.1 peptidylprolyl isomerase [Oceanospirillales bacterium]PSL13242.1 FKBP-type peptidyl prolyl cis-trans isomerase /apo-metallochaperone SlyD [Marinobacterium halophilum]
MQIAEKSVVSIHYTLTNAEGTVLDSSNGQEPLAYLHGASNIIPGLENALVGKTVGDSLQVTVEPEEGYGPVRDELVQDVERSAFAGIDNIETGMQFMAQTPWGEQPVTVVKIEGDNITLDGNHPLAGQTLTFDVEVVEVRGATDEEMEHGHAHGAGGHDH